MISLQIKKLNAKSTNLKKSMQSLQTKKFNAKSTN